MKKLLASGMVLALLSCVGMVVMARSSYISPSSNSIKIETDNMWLLAIYELYQIGGATGTSDVRSVRDLGGFYPNVINTDSFPDYVTKEDNTINGKEIDIIIYQNSGYFIKGVAFAPGLIDPKKAYIIRCATDNKDLDDALWTVHCTGNEIPNSALFSDYLIVR